MRAGICLEIRNAKKYPIPPKNPRTIRDKQCLQKRATRQKTDFNKYLLIPLRVVIAYIRIFLSLQTKAYMMHYAKNKN